MPVPFCPQACLPPWVAAEQHRLPACWVIRILRSNCRKRAGTPGSRGALAPSQWGTRRGRLYSLRAVSDDHEGSTKKWCDSLSEPSAFPTLGVPWWPPVQVVRSSPKPRMAPPMNPGEEGLATLGMQPIVGPPPSWRICGFPGFHRRVRRSGSAGISPTTSHARRKACRAHGGVALPRTASQSHRRSTKRKRRATEGSVPDVLKPGSARFRRCDRKRAWSSQTS